MDFIGYHGTSETAALNILSTGVRRECLPPTGQIGPGFYIARVKGELPEWGAVQATATARQRLWAWRLMISSLTGDHYNPFLPPEAERTILKIYTTRPLLKCKWGIMNPSNLPFTRAVLGPIPRIGQRRVLNDEQRQALSDMIREWSQWLQMVVPPEELQYLVARRDDGQRELTTNWRSNESPF